MNFDPLLCPGSVRLVAGGGGIWRWCPSILPFLSVLEPLPGKSAAGSGPSNSVESLSGCP